MRFASLFLAAATLGVSQLTPQTAAGQDLDPTESAVSARPAPACLAWEVTYALTGTLRISDTPMGAGDGVHPVGPGALVLRFDDHDGSPAGHAHVVSFELTEHFAVHPHAVLWDARVVTDAAARMTPDGSGTTGAGTLSGDVLRWDGPLHGFRTDGALTCDGSLCGRFGAPPPGRSPLHVASGAVQLEPLHFGRGATSFEMPFALIAETESPHQRTFLSMRGRESRRACVAPGASSPAAATASEPSSSSIPIAN
jgi:hypothetical protein